MAHVGLLHQARDICYVPRGDTKNGVSTCTMDLINSEAWRLLDMLCSMLGARTSNVLSAPLVKGQWSAPTKISILISVLCQCHKKHEHCQLIISHSDS